MRRWKVTGRILLVVAAACLLGFTTAEAKKPDNPGGGGGGGGDAGQNGGGEIYFAWEGGLFIMDDDGGNVRPATGFDPDFPHGGIPSRNLHAEKRWLLDWWYGGHPFLVKSDGGDVAELFIQPELEVVRGPYWSMDDAAVSFLAVRWEYDPESQTYGDALGAGIYELLYDVDPDGNIIGELGPALLVFEMPLIVDSDGKIRPDAADFDWAPDGNQFVYNRISAKELRIGNVATGGDSLLFDGSEKGAVGSALWSPAGDRIMFHLASGYLSVMMIDLERGRVKQIQSSTASWTCTAAAWSPTGSHLLLHHRDHFYSDSYILRMTASGAAKTRITGPDMGAGLFCPRVRGWR